MAASGDTACPTCTACPQQTPFIVYVTVTVPVPVPVATQAQTTNPTIKPTTTPIAAQETSLLDTLTSNYELLIYGGLILSVVIGFILMKRKQKKKPPAQSINMEALKGLFEEDSETIIHIPDTTVPEEPIQEKSKKPKKPKSLLEQDFEF